MEFRQPRGFVRAFSKFLDHFSVESRMSSGRSCSEDLENSVRGNYSFVVVIESIRKFNHAVPFVPYEIRTVSGETYEIPHPDFILVPPKGSYVVVIDSKDPKEAPNHISALLIERATPLDGQQRRKTRKRS